MKRVTVILPAYNEEHTIGQIIDLINLNNEIFELIVVDNNSTDNTAKIAMQKGATIIQCSQQGKGYAMSIGLKNCKTEFVVFLDSDVSTYCTDIIEKMINPILNDKADFVKSTFDRHQGRVTELTAKPLLKIFFPNLLRFSQPLSGMIAGKKSFFDKISFNYDYGVDIGILIDMEILNARIEEVNIGTIEHNSKQLVSLKDMALNVATVILQKGNVI